MEVVDPLSPLGVATEPADDLKDDDLAQVGIAPHAGDPEVVVRERRPTRKLRAVLEVVGVLVLQLDAYHSLVCVGGQGESRGDIPDVDRFVQSAADPDLALRLRRRRQERTLRSVVRAAPVRLEEADILPLPPLVEILEIVKRPGQLRVVVLLVRSVGVVGSAVGRFVAVGRFAAVAIVVGVRFVRSTEFRTPGKNSRCARREIRSSVHRFIERTSWVGRLLCATYLDRARSYPGSTHQQLGRARRARRPVFECRSCGRYRRLAASPWKTYSNSVELGASSPFAGRTSLVTTYRSRRPNRFGWLPCEGSSHRSRRSATVLIILE